MPLPRAAIRFRSCHGGAADRPAVRRPSGTPARARLGGDLAPARTSRATRCPRSTGPPRRACPPSAAATRSSSANARRRGAARHARARSPPRDGPVPAAAAVVLEAGGARRGAAVDRTSAEAARADVAALDYARRRALVAAAGQARAAGRSPSAPAPPLRGAGGQRRYARSEFLGRRRANLPAELRVRPSRLPRTGPRQTRGSTGRPRLGRRASGDPGPGLGAKLSRRSRASVFRSRTTRRGSSA